MTEATADKFFDLPGARIRYRDEGRGAVVILVHGWALDLDMWNSLAAALAPDYRVVRFDRRGFGLSAGRPSIAADAADVLAICEHLRIGDFALLGMSQGARVVLQVASASGTRVKGVVLDGAPSIDSAAALERAQELPYQHYQTLAQTAGMEAFRREWRKHPLACLRTLDADARALAAVMLERYPGSDLLAPTASAPALASIDIATIRQPTLVLVGQYDLDTRRRWAEEFARIMPSARLAQIAGAGHVGCLDNPDDYGRRVREFLQRCLR